MQCGAKVDLQSWVCKTEFILILLFIYYCIIFHTNTCKPTFAPSCILWAYVCASNSLRIVLSHKELLNLFGDTGCLHETVLKSPVV